MRVVDITKYTECECVASTAEMHFFKGPEAESSCCFADFGSVL